MSFFISNAMADAAAPAAASPMGGGFEWIFLVGFLVIFYVAGHRSVAHGIASDPGRPLDLARSIV